MKTINGFGAVGGMRNSRGNRIIFTPYSLFHMQTCVKILKFVFFFNFKIIFHTIGVLHVSTDMVIIRCFESC
jgi:hypothetical protein